MSLEKPIIFIGVGRSGTSLISEIVFQHEDLAMISVYQDKFPNSPMINLIRPLFENKLWRINGQKKQLNKVHFLNKYTFKPTEAYRFWESITGKDIDFSRGFLIDQKASKEKAEEIRSFFSKIVKFQGRKRIGFKITGPSRISYLKSIFPDALFVEVTREPFANIRSLLKVHFWKEKGMHQLWWTGAYSEQEMKQAEDLKNNPVLLTAMQYKKVRDVTNEELTSLDVRHLKIRYEDFLANPKEKINEILLFTGLKPSKMINKYLQKNQIFDQNRDSKLFFNENEIVALNEILRDYIDN